MTPGPHRVRFEFAGYELVGDVVDATTHATIRQFETVLTVESDESRYRVSNQKVTPA